MCDLYKYRLLNISLILSTFFISHLGSSNIFVTFTTTFQLSLVFSMYVSISVFFVTIPCLRELLRDGFRLSHSALILFHSDVSGASLLLSKTSAIVSETCFYDVKFLECHLNWNKAFFCVLLYRRRSRLCSYLPNIVSTSTFSSSSSSSTFFSSTISVAFSLLVHSRLEGVTMPRSWPPRHGTVVTISNEMKY